MLTLSKADSILRGKKKEKKKKRETSQDQKMLGILENKPSTEKLAGNKEKSTWYSTKIVALEALNYYCIIYSTISHLSTMKSYNGLK